MAKFVIEGGARLKGTVKISGNKNAVFPCLAASLLTGKDVYLRNLPNIADIEVSLEMLKGLGVEITVMEDYVKLNAHKIESHILPAELSQRLRGSVVFVGGLLGRVGKVKFTHPGGDIIGKRSIEPHLMGFAELGFNISQDDLEYLITRSSNLPDKVTIFLDDASVTATENLILSSVIGSHKVTLKNCAQEPHVVDLCNMLFDMGAKVAGQGTPTITITGVKELSGTDFTIGPDFIEMGTYAVAAAITEGDIKLTNFKLDDLEPITYRLEKMGITFKIEQGGYRVVSATKIKAIPKLHTNIWPGFPTDLMSVFIVLATQADGVSLLHDWMYESRFFFVDKLISMGANITIADPHRVVVYGPTKLHSRNLETPDIRAGMALVLAALIATGKSTINRAELIERGYEDVVGKLVALGVSIEKID